MVNKFIADELPSDIWGQIALYLPQQRAELQRINKASYFGLKKPRIGYITIWHDFLLQLDKGQQQQDKYEAYHLDEEFKLFPTILAPHIKEELSAFFKQLTTKEKILFLKNMLGYINFIEQHCPDPVVEQFRVSLGKKNLFWCALHRNTHFLLRLHKNTGALETQKQMLQSFAYLLQQSLYDFNCSELRILPFIKVDWTVYRRSYDKPFLRIFNYLLLPETHTGAKFLLMNLLILLLLDTRLGILSIAIFFQAVYLFSALSVLLINGREIAARNDLSQVSQCEPLINIEYFPLIQHKKIYAIPSQLTPLKEIIIGNKQGDRDRFFAAPPLLLKQKNNRSQVLQELECDEGETPNSAVFFRQAKKSKDNTGQDFSSNSIIKRHKD